MYMHTHKKSTCLDDMLIKYFIVERWKLLWPHSLWAAIWCVYRAAYHVGMSLVLVIFVDVVWFDDATIAALNAADATNATQIGSGGGMGEAEGQDGNFGQSLVLSTVLTGIVVLGWIWRCATLDLRARLPLAAHGPVRVRASAWLCVCACARGPSLTRGANTAFGGAG